MLDEEEEENDVKSRTLVVGCWLLIADCQMGDETLPLLRCKVKKSIRKRWKLPDIALNAVFDDD